MIAVSPLCGNFGATVTGIDFGQPFNRMLRNQLYQLWLEHGILLVRGDNVSPEGQIEFSRIFGELEAHPLKSIRSDTYPELMELSSDNTRSSPVARWHGREVIGYQPWHKDLIYTGKPNRGAVLRAVILPEHDGETGYADQGKAYEALPEDLRTRIDDLKVIYRFEVNYCNMPFLDTSDFQAVTPLPSSPVDAGFPDYPDSVYPLVIVHPETGRKSLNVCPMFLVAIYGMDSTEGDDLLRYLVDHVTRPEFTYLHKWQADEMILWDNWRFMHSAPGVVTGQRRLIHRTTIGSGDCVLGQPANAVTS